MSKFSLINVKSGMINLGKKFAGEFRKNSPSILSATAIVGVVATVVAVIKCTDKVKEIHKEHEEDLKDIYNSNASDEEKLTLKKDINKGYIYDVGMAVAPSVILGAGTIACIIFSQKINNRRIAALSAAYTIAENNLIDYKKKVAEIFGETKAEKVDDEVLKDHVDKAFGDGENIIIQNTGHGMDIFFDDFTGQIFYSDLESVISAKNEYNSILNQEAADHMYGRYNVEEFYEKDMHDLYYELGIQDPKAADLRKWRSDTLMGIHTLWTERSVNGRMQKVCAIVWTGDIHPQWRDNLL